MPFGLKNAVPCFQRKINEIITKFKCEGTFAYLDDITVCGKTREEHDKNLKAFLQAGKHCNITFNTSKCCFATDTVNLLGYQISHGTIQPDSVRVAPLLSLPVPQTAKELQRIVGMFAYYSQWIPQFSEKIKPLIFVKQFPLGEKGLKALSCLKYSLSSATLKAVDETLPFVVETDASDNAILLR